MHASKKLCTRVPGPDKKKALKNTDKMMKGTIHVCLYVSSMKPTYIFLKIAKSDLLSLDNSIILSLDFDRCAFERYIVARAGEVSPRLIFPTEDPLLLL